MGPNLMSWTLPSNTLFFFISQTQIVSCRNGSVFSASFFAMTRTKHM